MPPEPDRKKVLVGTPVLDRLEQSNLPFRGRRRQEALRQIRETVRQRRTTTGVAQRLGNLTVGTAGQAAIDGVQSVIEEDLERVLDQALDE